MTESDIASQLKQHLEELKETCEQMVYYIEHPHFDGHEVTLNELERSISALPGLMEEYVKRRESSSL